MGCQEQIKVPKSCLQYGYFLQDAHILYYLWFDVKTCFEWSYIDQLGANSLLVSSLVKCPTTNQYGMGFQQDELSGIVREKQFYLIWIYILIDYLPKSPTDSISLPGTQKIDFGACQSHRKWVFYSYLWQRCAEENDCYHFKRQYLFFFGVNLNNSFFCDSL